MKTIAGILLLVIVVVIAGCYPAQESGSCSSKELEIKVADFGAVPNDGKNDTPAIAAAIEACKGRKSTRLVFGPGRYDINAGSEPQTRRRQPSLKIENIDNMTIEGNGAELIGRDYSTMFHFSQCRNIAINNLTVDWDPVPFTQGKVVEANSDYVDIEVVAPFTAQAGRRTEALLGYDPELKRMARRYTDHNQKGYEKTSEIVRPGVMRLFIGRQDRFAGVLPPVGKHIIVRHQVYNYQAFEFLHCSKVRMENVNIYSNPGMGVIGRFSSDFLLRRLNVMLRPGSGRWMSSTADATNFGSCRGTIVMENCLFEGMGDDATNVNAGHYQVVAERSGDKELIIGCGPRDRHVTLPQIGDRLELSGQDLVPYATVAVKSVKSDGKEKTFVVELSDKLPERTAKGDIVGNASACPSVRIRGCTVSGSRARGFILKTRDAVIEDCTLQNVSASGIAMNTDLTAWWESVGSQDVIIRNNRFIDCRFERAYVSGVIECLAGLTGQEAAGIHRRITVENNIIQGTDGNAIRIGYANQADIVGNVIDNSNKEAIFIHNSRNVRVTGNKVTNSNTGLGFGDGCDTATIEVADNVGF